MIGSRGGSWLCGFKKSHSDKKISADFFRIKSVIRNPWYPKGAPRGGSRGGPSVVQREGYKRVPRGFQEGLGGPKGGPRGVPWGPSWSKGGPRGVEGGGSRRVQGCSSRVPRGFQGGPRKGPRG